MFSENVSGEAVRVTKQSFRGLGATSISAGIEAVGADVVGELPGAGAGSLGVNR
jgi:hypothetical protein